MGLVIDIDGEGLDLFEGTDFYITKQINDLSDLSTRNADFTKSIKVPTTAKNVRLLQLQDLFDTADAQAVVSIACNITIGGVPIAVNANLLADSVSSGNEVELTIFFGNFDFFNKIEGNIRDMDFSDEAFTYDIDTIDGTNTRYALAAFTTTQITFQAAEPNPALLVGETITLEEDGNPVPGSYQTAIVTNVVSPQIYDVIMSPSILPNTGTLFAIVNDPTGALKAKTTGAVYAFADWFNLVATVRLETSSAFKWSQDIKLAGFFFFTQTIINRIITDTGFTLDRTAITDPLYDTIAVECPLPIFVLQSSDATLGEQRKAATQLISGIGAGAGNDTVERVTFISSISISEDATWDNPNSQYIWTGDNALIHLQVFLNFTLATNGAGQFVTIRLFQNAVELAAVQYDRLATDTIATLSADVTAVGTDAFYVEVTADGSTGGNGGEINVIGTPTFDNTNFLIGKQGAAADPNIANPATWFPDMSKRNFLVGVLEMMNIVMQTDSLEKTVTFEFFQGIKDNPEQAPLVAIDQGYEQTTLLGNYFRNSDFKYLDEGSDLFRTDTNIIFNFDDERLPIDGTVIELPFAACDESVLYDNRANTAIPLASMNAYEFELDRFDGASWTTGTSVANVADADEIEIGNYIGGQQGINSAQNEYRRVTAVLPPNGIEVEGAWNYTRLVDENSSLITLDSADNRAKIARIIPQQDSNPDFATGVGFLLTDGFISSYAGSFSQNPPEEGQTGRLILNGQDAVFDAPMLWNSLLTNQYLELLTALKRPLIVQASLILTPAEFDAINFLRPIYIGEPFQSQFYLNIMEQYKENQPVRCTLVRI